MDLSYYNPLVRLKLISSAWQMAERVAIKLAEHRGATDYSTSDRIDVFADYFKAFIVHGISLKQYEDYEVYKVKHCVRKGIMSNRRALSFIAKMNNSDMCRELENKVLFNKKWLRRKSPWAEPNRMVDI